MAAFLSITESMTLQALGDWMTSILPGTTDGNGAAKPIAIVQGQDNKVAEPGVLDFVVMWPTLRERLETNVDDYADITLIGSMAGSVLTVTEIAGGTLQPGQTVWAPSLTSGTLIVKQLTGTSGGIGTYQTSTSQTLASQALAAGLVNVTSPMKCTIQVDVHGPRSADNAQIIATLFRDEVACDFFTNGGYPVQPLYCDNGRQIPFVNGEGQYESRWVLMAHLQINPVVSTPQQFADTLKISGLKEIDTTFPPGA